MYISKHLFKYYRWLLFIHIFVGSVFTHYCLFISVETWIAVLLGWLPYKMGKE
jgi:hypothetical protein